MKITTNEINRKIEILLDNKVLNYVFIDEPDQEENYRLAVELTKEEAEKIRAALMNGDLSAREKECLEAGQLLNAKTKYKPVLSSTSSVENAEFYSGCVGAIVVVPYRYQYREKGRNYTGISYGLRAVLKQGEGERLGNCKSAADYFGELLGDEPF